jgi:hypothetical protein
MRGLVRTLGAPVLLIALAGRPANAQQAAGSDGTTTGQRIGNIISAAVSTAFPGVSKVIEAIWPRGSDQGRTVKQEDAKLKLQQAQDAATKAEKRHSDDLNTAAANLAAARKFITECSFASIQISSMERLLAARGTNQALTATEKGKLGDLWRPASTRLSSLTDSALDAPIQKIDDNYLKATLQAIRDAITNNSANVTKQIDDGRAVELTASLSNLAPQIYGVGPLAGLLVGDLSTSLASAANNISAHAGPPATATIADPVADRKNNVATLKSLYGQKIK